MPTTARSRFVGLLAGTALVLTARIAGFAPAPAPGGGDPSWVLPAPLRLPAADFNGDGHPDYASVVNEGGGSIRIAATGCGPIELPLIDALASVTVIDYDADGDPDVVGLGVGGRLFIWQNQGGCRLVPRSPLGPPRSAGHGSSVGPTASAGDSLRTDDTRRHSPTLRRVVRLRADVQLRLLRSSGHPCHLPQSISTDAQFSRPPPPSRPAAS